MSPGIIAMYAALTWLAISIPAGILIGRALRAANHLATGRCQCGMCAR